MNHCNPELTNGKPFFSKDVTNIIKGIALIMMFIYHFLTLPAWWLPPTSYPVIEKFALCICEPFRICVPVFCFLTGYFYFFNTQKTMKYSIKKIIDLYISYWTVFLLFAIIAVYSVGYHYTFSEVILEMFALSDHTMIFCWYVCFFSCVMLLMPLVSKIFTKNVFTDIIFSIIIVPLILHFIVFTTRYQFRIINFPVGHMRLWYTNVLIGYIFAQNDLFLKIKDINDKIVKNRWGLLFSLLIMAFVIPMGRYVLPEIAIASKPIPVIHKAISFWISLDVIYAPLFIYCIVRLCNLIDLNFLKKGLIVIGRYSMLLWFLHCIFFANSKTVFQPVLYWPHNPVLVVLWGLFLCLICAIPLQYIIEKIIFLKNLTVSKLFCHKK